MTAARDYGAPRGASLQRLEVVSICCDGPDLLKSERPCRPIRGVTAVEARRHARSLGWRVGIKDHRFRLPRDFCPEHLDRAPESHGQES